jgi:hypothetical protein
MCRKVLSWNHAMSQSSIAQNILNLRNNLSLLNNIFFGQRRNLKVDA